MMAAKANTFTKFFDTFAETLSLINLRRHLSVQNKKHSLDHAAKLLELLNKAPQTRRRDHLVSGAALVSADPFCDDEFIRTIAYTSRSIPKSRFVDAIEEFDRKTQASCLGEAFEAVERLLREIGAEFLWQKRGVVALSQKKAFNKSLLNQSRRPKENTPDYFRAYTRFVCRRNCDKLLKVLKGEIPGFEERASNYPDGANLFEAFEAVEFCRHSVVHNNGKVDESHLAAKKPSVRERVQSLMWPSHLWGGSVILPNEELTREELSRLAGLGYILYRTASTACGMRNDARLLGQ